MKLKVRIALFVIFAAVIGGFYYAYFPAINIHLEIFWTTLIVVFLSLAIILGAKSSISQMVGRLSKKPSIKEFSWFAKLCSVLVIVCVGVLIVGSALGATLFRSRAYANLLPVDKREFTEDIEQSDQVTDIALMDTESARIFGNRKIGSLSDVVSQYEIEADYTQISIKGQPMKVSGLKYASFFKWWNNRNSGVPGYVQVNPVNSEAKYVKLTKPMKYVPSAYFNYNLQRHVQLTYPTKIISGYKFEVDDDGNPYYICPTMTARVGLFGGIDVNGVIICDPIDGECKYYAIGDCPSWVDSVYDGHLLTKKYNWHGMLSGGYINSIIGQKGCKQATDDFGYKIIGDDVWVYTGVTSANGDQSNIGFVMMNQRTSEARYYQVSGAEEHSAMSAAEGEVQEKGYKASFPSLINVSGTPTYIMVLKDAGGLVKLYAMVNVEQYNIVATATSQTKVFEEYKTLLASDGKLETEENDLKEDTITVQSVEYIDSDDGTMVYIKDTNHQVYKQAFKEDESLIRISAGDVLHVKYQPMDNEIHLLQEFSFETK
ncbi:hypothetical protein DXB73_05745 [Clostridium sp. OM05-6BH]|jgi:hypothetical protein|uniref:hypothetical protein n=1 Tax=unclassified Clostridium TaxID=2614128 RepID=UPI000E4765F4|nr:MULTISPECIES: hypothetical protein [unclassified Clostridium]RHV15423.1 hypothetical protein DXB78_07220 [Clostridium sp. OM05-9BH]RHV19719.1 hypothetical protein DXB73_05745 [Clostridium sp. OM05-6BH]